MKKKLMAILMAGILSAAMLTGCGGSSSAPAGGAADGAAGGDAASADATTEAPADAAAEGGYKIALIQQHQTNAFQIAVTEAAEAKAKELGVDLTILSADQDAAKQISQIEQCTSEGYQAILFEPVDPDGLGDAAQAAADKGVIMINVISACTDWENHGISALSCGDNVTAGETEMQHVADLLGGKGNIAILMTSTRSSARTTAWQSAQATLQAQTAASSSPVLTAPPTASRPSRTAESPAQSLRTAALWQPTASKQPAS